jgi:hypothetical protein
MQQQRRFHRVQNPLVHTLVQEKAGTCNTHPDVFAQLDATDKGKLSEKKVDILLVKQKCQGEEGLLKGTRFFTNIKKDKLPWVVVSFKDGKVD